MLQTSLDKLICPQMFLTEAACVYLKNTGAFLDVYSSRPSFVVHRIMFMSTTLNSIGAPPTLMIT